MRLIGCFAICLLLTRGYAQQSFLNLRYDEDYSYLAIDTSRSSYERLKYTPLSDQVYVSAGGEIRYLAQYYENEDWGDAPKREYTSFYTRYLFHGHLKWRNRLAIFAQLNSTFANGRITPNRSIDENRADLHQAFLDISLLNHSNHKLVLRTGRQELFYGSQRIIAVREGPNNRQSFDAVKLLFQSQRVKADFFISRPVQIRQGTFDDVSNLNQSLWSAYIVINRLTMDSHLDLYYIGFSDDDRTFDAGTASEQRHSLGFRAWRKGHPFQFDIEALYQFGDFGTSTIDAYTASVNASYRFTSWRLQPAIGVKTEVISGDNTRDDNELNTFNPLFPRGAYFGLAALIGPSNLIDFHPSIDLSLHKNITFMADFDVFWRHSINDGIYGPNTALLYGSNSPSAFIGRQIGLSFEFTPNKHLTCIPEFMWFDAGTYLKDVSAGKDVVFGALTIQFKY
jgi:hypothetical protein